MDTRSCYLAAVPRRIVDRSLLHVASDENRILIEYGMAVVN